MSRLHVILPFLIALALPGASLALVQDKAQQRCINGQNQRGADLAREQGRLALSCLREASRGRVDRLGGPGQEKTALACLGNDVRGKLARRDARLSKGESKRCLPAQQPGFAYRSATAIGDVAREEPIGLALDLFGPDLDAAIAPWATARDDARCQQDTLRAAQSLYDRLWKIARKAKADALAGRKRTVGDDPRRPSSDPTDLLAEIVDRIAADAKGRIERKSAALTKVVTRRCTGADLPGLFPGVCAASADPPALADCAEGAARGRFYRSLSGFDALAVSCDLEDDGSLDLSCLDPALAAHVLNRTGFGWNAWSSARLAELGLEAYLAEQLDPESLVEDPELEALLAARFPSLALDFEQLRLQYPQNPPDRADPRRGDVPRELQQAALLTRVMTRRQLQAVLVDVWFNHFNVDGNGGRRKWDTTPYWRDAIRPHVLGRFADLLIATARAPAMADYLDNRRNVVSGINENYSRELLELHTLSVDGPFDEADVVEVARILTGWRIDYSQPDGFEFDPGRHDFGAKSVLGDDYPAGVGYAEGEALLEALAMHPSTASFVARKLLRRLVRETPSDEQVAEIAQVFLASDGDLRAVTEAILLSDAFLFDPTIHGAKVKRPQHFYVSAARALGADPAALNLNRMRKNAARSGESLFQAPPPTGYPDASGAWTGPGSLMDRLNEIEAVSRGQQGFVFAHGIPPGSDDPTLVDALIAAVFLAPVSGETREGAIDYLTSLPPGLGDGVREAQALAFLLSSPEFGTH